MCNNLGPYMGASLLQTILALYQLACRYAVADILITLSSTRGHLLVVCSCGARARTRTRPHPFSISCSFARLSESSLVLPDPTHPLAGKGLVTLEQFLGCAESAVM